MVIHSQVGTVKPNPHFHGYVSHIFPLLKSHFVALSDPNWRDTMYDEYALIKNGTWILVSKRPIYKARLVASGSTQQLGVDCDDTFSSVVKPTTIRTVTSLALSRNWTIHQLDVKNAFLNGNLSETVYMHLVFGFSGLQAMPYGLVSHQVDVTHPGPYIDVVLRAHMANCNPTRTPVDTKSKLGSDGDPISNPFLYRSLAEPHFAALKRVLRYVSGTLDFGLQLYTSSTGSLVAYSDADWPGCPTTRRSTSVAETAWLRNLLLELHTPLLSATIVYCDNVSAIYLTANLVQHQRIKHIEIDIHFVRDIVARGEIRVLHVPSRYQYADIFIKDLLFALFEEFCTSLSVRPSPAQTAEEC
nr:hypothetical protein [Tanacetum cinerariifolium]